MSWLSRAFRVPPADSALNRNVAHVSGNKTDVASRTADVASIMAVVRKALDEATEAAHHFHSGERWFGAAAVPAGETHIADRIGAGAAGAECGPLTVDAGNDDWGTWTQILGSDDTPCDGGSKVKYDLHMIRIAAWENNAQRYMFQIAAQEDAPADDPGPTDDYTEDDMVSAGPGALESVEPITIQNCRVLTGTKCWMRTRAPNQNTSLLSFFIGLHEYTYL